jgi:hypothetical protein
MLLLYNHKSSWPQKPPSTISAACLAKIPLCTIYWKGKEWTFDACSCSPPEYRNDVKVVMFAVLGFHDGQGKSWHADPTELLNTCF